MLQNVVRAAKELDMQYFLFLGNTCAHTMKYWNEKAKIVWEEFAQDPHYRRYGFGDDRPMMTIFLPGKDFAAHLKRSKPEEKNWLEKFRIGTCQVNDPIVPTPTDGWGYRNKSAGSTDLARFAAPLIFISRLRLRRDFCYTYCRGRLDCVLAVMRLVSDRVA